MKLGFSIGYDVFGYGLVLCHYGSIVVGPSNRIGNYAVLFTSTCITNFQKTIGDGLFVSTGAKIVTCENLGNAITIAANSVVTHGVHDNNVLLAGVPAVIKKDRQMWYEFDDTYLKRVQKIEALRKQLFHSSNH